MKRDTETSRRAYIKREAQDANRDPITGAPGSHPVGTGIGAATAGAAGAVLGSIAGPVGAAVGGIVGAVAGGAIGKGAAEAIDPTIETKYWREQYASEPYFDSSIPFEDYEPAYRFGYEAYERSSGATLDDIEDELRTEWEEQEGNSRLDWEQARPAVYAAWNRAAHPYTGD